MAQLFRKSIIAQTLRIGTRSSNKTLAETMGEILVLAHGTPVLPVAASGVLTITDVVADGQTVTIGADVYEFDTDATVSEGHILVDVSGGVTAAAAVTALVAAITANAASLVSGADGTGDTVALTAKTAGVVGNSIVTAETCANASFAHATLVDGVDGTVAADGAVLIDASTLYVSVGASTIAASNWKKVALSAVT